jgi:hypothetical protein
LATYDGHLVCWCVRPTPSSNGAYTATLEVALSCHNGSVPSLAGWSARGGACTLASGGADEAVRVFDLRARRSVGALLQHNGTVTALAFVAPGRTLLSGGEDGSIIVWRAGDWCSLLTMAGHRGRIEALAPHPSGRVALSLGRDATLRLWDLTKGRQAHAQPARPGGRAAAWASDGGRFFILYDSAVGVHEGGDGAEVAMLAPPEGRACGALSSVPRLHCMALLPLPRGGQAVAVGAEGGDVLLWDAAGVGAEGAATCVVLPTGHVPRVRALAALQLLCGEGGGGGGDGGGSGGSGGGGSGGGGGGGSGAAPAPEPPKGLAKLSAESVAIELSSEAGAGMALVTVGSDGVVHVWDARALGAQLAAARAGAKKLKGAGGKARESGGSSVGALVLAGVAPVATLRAAHNTRPTGVVGVDAI